MLRFVGSQTAVGSMTIRPGRLYAVEITICGNGRLTARVSDGYRCALVPYDSIEALFENWERR